MTGQKQKKKVTPKEEQKERREKESSNFLSIFTQYASSIDALREFVSNICPMVTEMEKGIAKKEEAYLKEVMDDFKREATKDEILELENFFEFFTERLTNKRRTKTKKISFTTESTLVGSCIVKILKVSLGYRTKGVHHELLNKSILMSLVSYFEVLVAELAHAFYRIAPDAISTDDKVLSVNELKRFSSIDEALRSIVSDRIDKLLRESVNDWQEFFQSRMKIDMKLLAPDWVQFNEYFQRRHIVVHAGGRATERYLFNVDWEELEPYMTKPSLGGELHIDDTYIENALNAFEVSGLLLCQEVWKKLVPGDSARYHKQITKIGLLEEVYNRLLSRHWYVAERLASWGEKDNEASEDDMLVCKFNRWLCVKRQGHWSEVEEEVKAFDLSAKNRKYQLVKASLMDDVGKFFELLPATLSAGDINIEALKEWPILDEMRTDPRFAEFIIQGNKKN